MSVHVCMCPALSAPLEENIGRSTGWCLHALWSLSEWVACTCFRILRILSTWRSRHCPTCPLAMNPDLATLQVRTQYLSHFRHRMHSAAGTGVHVTAYSLSPVRSQGNLSRELANLSEKENQYLRYLRCGSSAASTCVALAERKKREFRLPVWSDSSLKHVLRLVKHSDRPSPRLGNCQVFFKQQHI